MTTSADTAADPGRIIGFDVARALAVFGMVLVNYKLVIAGGGSQPAWLAASLGLLEGRAAAVFVVLAGVGVSLLTRAARLSDQPSLMSRARTRLLKRAVFLFIAGLLYLPLWPADILHYYGVYLAVAALLAGVPGGVLLLVCSLAVLGFVILGMTLDYAAGWNFDTLDYLDLWTLPGMLRHLLFNGFHPLLPWLGFLVFGMWLGRQPLLQLSLRRRLLVLGVSVALAAELASLVLLTFDDSEIGHYFFDTAPMPPMPLYMLAATGTALALIMLCVEWGLRRPGSRAIRWLAVTGQLALTLYIAHVVIGMGVLESVAGLGGHDLSFAVMYASGFCLLGLMFAVLWRRHFQHGPVEWLMRRLLS